MESHEVLRSTVKELGVKSVASELGLSTSLIYKWCEPSEGDNATGADNPLDRIAKLCAVTGNKDPVVWLCQQADGILVENPEVEKQGEVEVLSATQTILQEFSELLEAVTDSVNNDSRVDCEESKRIRTEWEALKRAGEQFVVACEMGVYGEKPTE
jgi:hypothetical protein